MKQTKFIFIVIVFLAFTVYAGSDAKTDMASPVQKAADFELPDQDGKMWKLSDAVKEYRAVVLAFYPKDDTGV
ncbi:MAG: redoxin domain-containing protein [Smithellaceae bacterium]|jgi:cytochrome oxidase Cu insertion factor (SCO1/SenC/PrrC family)|nr:redoxin domain-containing protein [Smithellaceae bacterium]